jgi:hypothetical protein
VKAIHAQKEPERVVYYRHQSLQPRFDRFAGQWYHGVLITMAENIIRGCILRIRVSQ